MIIIPLSALSHCIQLDRLCANWTHPTEHELSNTPVLVVTVIEYGDGDVPIVDGPRVERPIVITLLAALLDATRQHHDGARVALPAHAPEVIPRRVQRALRHHKLAGGIVALEISAIINWNQI